MNAIDFCRVLAGSDCACTKATANLKHATEHIIQLCTSPQSRILVSKHDLDDLCLNKCIFCRRSHLFPGNIETSLWASFFFPPSTIFFPLTFHILGIKKILGKGSYNFLLYHSVLLRQLSYIRDQIKTKSEGKNILTTAPWKTLRNILIRTSCSWMFALGGGRLFYMLGFDFIIFLRAPQLVSFAIQIQDEHIFFVVFMKSHLHMQNHEIPCTCMQMMHAVISLRTM